MKICPFGITCGVLVCFSSVSFAAMVGSSRPVAQANFQQLIKTNACPSCDLAGVVLTRIDLSDANLENANLAGAQLFLTDLSNANLRNANLQGAKLGGADLGGADLRGANLTGAVLEGAYLQDALLDGKIVSETPYVEDDLPEVTEKKYIEDASQGKKAPYTQEAVVTDTRLPEQPLKAASTPQDDLQPSMAGDTQQQTSKKMVPMANAVVHDQGSVQSATSSPAVNGEAVAKEQGFWNSVTTFFSKDSASVKSTPVQPETVTPQAVKPAAQSKKMVPMAEVVVPTKTDSQPAPAVAADTDKAKQKEGGLWSSITSIFSSDKEKAPQVQQKPVTEQPQSVSSSATGKDALADNAGVRKMIEQIEGPAPETAEPVKVVEPHATVVVAQENKVASPAKVEEASVVAAEEKPEAPITESAAAIESAADKVATAATATVATAVSQGKAMVYDVVTPAQARLKQQEVIARLLDEEQCVGCDLAGADLSGQDLEKADLERVNLQGANLAGIDLEEANLKGAQLSGANLRDADLREADLYMADFSGADLTGAELEGALIDSADFTDAVGVNLAGAVKDE